MDIVQRSLELGASGAAEIRVAQIEFAPELRELCEQNVCGNFGRNHTCPPDTGDVDALIARLKTYDTAAVWQNIYPLEDSFDIEGMNAAKQAHDKMTRRLAREMYRACGREGALVLGAGGCTRCCVCARKTDRPCRHPEAALSSLEAYGILVASLEAVTGLKYINGPNTVTFFSGAFTRRRSGLTE